MQYRPAGWRRKQNGGGFFTSPVFDSVVATGQLWLECRDYGDGYGAGVGTSG